MEVDKNQPELQQWQIASQHIAQVCIINRWMLKVCYKASVSEWDRERLEITRKCSIEGVTVIAVI